MEKIKIKNKIIEKYVNEHCHIENDNEGTILSNNNDTFIDTLQWLVVNSYKSNLIKFLAKHNIYELYSYSDFRKSTKSKVACCGFSETEQKWYGWTNHGVRCFGIGDKYFDSKPAKTLEDCKKLAYIAVKALS